jgi:hypothetical protein
VKLARETPTLRPPEITGSPSLNSTRMSLP